MAINIQTKRPALQCTGCFIRIAVTVSLALKFNIVLAAVETSATKDFSLMSLEELSNIEIISVSRTPERILDAPAAITVITNADIRRSGATSIPEALRLVHNLNVAQKNSHDWAISARGFNTEVGNKLLVMIDGRTVYSPLYSGVFWDRQDYLLEDIDRIEVISGPGSTLWGVNAVNGVINIITKSSKETQGTYFETGFGNELKNSTSIRYGGKLAPNVSYRIYGKYFDRDDQVYANGSPANDAWHMGQGGFRIDAETSAQNSFTLQGDYYNGDEGDPITRNDAVVRGNNILGRWTHAFSDDSDMSLQLYYDRTHLQLPVAATSLFLPIPEGILTDDLETYDVDFQHRFKLNDRNRIVWGLGYRYTHNSVNSAPAVALDPEHRDQYLYSAFIQDEIKLHERLHLTVGTKIEHTDYTGWEFEPSARMQWQATSHQMVWAAISRAVRTPSRLDRDLRTPTGLPAPFDSALSGSDDFDSENVIAYEIGYRAQLGSSFSTSITAFYNEYDDVRSLSFTPATLVPLFLDNNLEGETQGVELSADYQVMRWWRLRLGYSYLEEDIRVKDGELDIINNALNETADPQHQVSLRSSMDLPYNMELDAQLRWVDELRINNVGIAAEVPNYTELSVRLGWRPTDRLELSLTGQNVLHDEHVEYGLASAEQVEIERSIYGKVQWRF